MSKQWIALIPAYEPDSLLIDFLEKLKVSGFQTVVVDDGSSLKAGPIFRQASEYARVLTHPHNQGKGAALKTGLAYIRETFGRDVIVITLDADGQHSSVDAIRLCRYAEEHPNTLVLGSRQLAENVPLRSQFGNTVTRLVYRLATGVAIHDTQTGMRAFHGSLIPLLLAVEGSRYEYEMNMLLDFASRKIPMKEITIETIYLEENASSHFDTLADSCRIYKEILKFSASSFLGFLIDYALYGVLLLALAAMPAAAALRIANIGARLVSATFNFFVNRNVVFKKSGSLGRAAVRYALLAAGILAINTAVLSLLVQGLGVNALLAKVLTEVVLFFFSWLMQRRVVFREEASYVS